jgi:hypothetical protein
MHRVLLSTIISPTAGPDLTVILDIHTYIVCGEVRVWVGIHRFSTVSPNRPSSMNGVPNAFAICAWPVVSAPEQLAHRF